MSVQILDDYKDTLPDRPYCTDDYRFGVLIRDKAEAIQKKYIQSNTPFDLKWLTYDLDTGNAYFDWYEQEAPAPNILAWNPETANGHYFYGLETPVYSQDACRNHKAYRYMASIDVALTAKLKADPAYSKVIQKNPLHDYWHVETLQKNPYTLDWLADYLDLSTFTDRRKNLPPVGLGRNCTLFDRTRRWAYRNIRGSWLNFDAWHYAVFLVCHKYNDFSAQLPESEIRSISKSVAKWTWTNMDREGFQKWAENRRKKSLEARRKKALHNACLIQEYLSKKPEATQKEIAICLRINQSTVCRLLSSDITNAYSSELLALSSDITNGTLPGGTE